MRKYRNRIIAGFLIGFLIYVVLLLLGEAAGFTDDLMAQLSRYPWLILVPVVLQKFTAWFFRFLEWQYYLGVIGARDKISVFDSAVLFVSGFTMAVSPGKAAEVLKSVVLKSKTGIPVAVSAPVVVAERVVDGLAVIVLALLSLILAGDGIELGPYRPLIFISAGLLIFGLIAIQIRPLAYFCLRVLAHIPLLRRMHDWLAAFYESSYEIFKLKHILPTTGFGILASLGDGIGFMIILSGFGIEITWLLFFQSMVIVSLASAIGALSGVPNGAGITEISVNAMVMIIVAPFNPQVTQGVAIAAAVIEGFLHKWLRVLCGLVVAIVFRKRLFGEGFEAALEDMEQNRQPAAVRIEGSGV